ncbi:MAG: hypothetical protein A2138_16305 [Deltaproteobacteria bacterium RBG_16_71_12]|nr:MAG: hypothetical protein A2138_16305 [Deltaproteobacteria bacterium RBG_16_71_12]
MTGTERQRSLRTTVLTGVLTTFGVLTVVIAVGLAAVLKSRLETDLTARAKVLGRALQESAEVSVGAGTDNRKLVERGLEWLTTLGGELVHIVVLKPDGKSAIAGVAQDGILPVEVLQATADKPPAFLQVRVDVVLASTEEPAASDDPLDAIAAEEGAVARGDPIVRIVLSGAAQLLQQTLAVLLTGVLLGLIAIVALWSIADLAFRRIEPALEHARRMALGDFSQGVGSAEFRELSGLFEALDAISQSLSSMLAGVRGVGDEVGGAVERIKAAATSLRAGSDQGTRAVSVTEGAVAAMAKGVDESSRRLTDLATTADASSRDTDTIERTNASTVETVRALRGEVERHGKSLAVIGERVVALSKDARAVGDASEAARGAATRMQRTSADGVTRSRQAVQLADDAMRDTNVGGKAIEDAVARIQEIARHAATMEGSLRALTDGVEGMTPVLCAIADVTSRTSLLALNAGIIAAQAGERGAAFQVVVDELKSLASRTAQLTATVEQRVRTVLEQRGRTDEAAVALRQVVQTSIEDAHRAGSALEAIRASTAQSQSMSAGTAEALGGQEQDVQETLLRVDVLEAAGRSVEGTARALVDEMRVLQEVADRVANVSDDVARASREQGELAQRVGQVLGLVSRQVRELSASQAEQHTDVVRVERSLAEIRRFSEDARVGAQQLEGVVERVRQKTTGLAEALHRFRTRA